MPGTDFLHRGLFAAASLAAGSPWASVTVTRALPALTTSIGLLAVPVMGLLSSMISLGEPLTWSLTVGLVGIVLGLALVNMADLHAARRARAQ